MKHAREWAFHAAGRIEKLKGDAIVEELTSFFAVVQSVALEDAARLAAKKAEAFKVPPGVLVELTWELQVLAKEVRGG